MCETELLGVRRVLKTWSDVEKGEGGVVVEGRAKEGRRGVLFLCRSPPAFDLLISPRNNKAELPACSLAAERVSDPATLLFLLDASLQ